MSRAAAVAPMTAAELRDRVREVAADPARWEGLCRFDPARRCFERELVDPLVEVWVISWMPGHDTGFHDHGTSSGAFTVPRGELVEELLTVGRRARRRTLWGRRVIAFGPDHVHRVLNAASAPAVSIHAYSPPLTDLGAYTVAPGGALRRAPRPFDAELRPLSAALR